MFQTSIRRVPEWYQRVRDFTLAIHETNRILPEKPWKCMYERIPNEWKIPNKIVVVDIENTEHYFNR